MWNLPYFANYQPQSAPIIPRFYFDVVSQEQRIKKLFEEYANIISFIDNIVDELNENDLNQLYDKLSDRMSEIDRQIEDMLKRYNALKDEITAYNPTRGLYESSEKTNRDMYRELAVFGARVNDVASLTAKQLSEHSNLETAVIGNYTIFNNKEPRVTGVENHD